MVRMLGWRKGVGSFRKHPQLVRRFNELIGSRLDAANSHSVITLSEKHELQSPFLSVLISRTLLVREKVRTRNIE